MSGPAPGRRRVWPWVASLLVALAAFAALRNFGGPALRGQVEEALARRLGQPVSITGLDGSVGDAGLQVELRGLRIGAAHHPVLQAGRVVARADSAAEAWAGRLALLRIEDLTLRLGAGPDGRPLWPAPVGGDGGEIAWPRIEIANARLELDLPAQAVGELRFETLNLRPQGRTIDADAALQLALSVPRVASARLHLVATLAPTARSIAALRVVGQGALGALQLDEFTFAADALSAMPGGGVEVTGLGAGARLAQGPSSAGVALASTRLTVDAQAAGDADGGQLALAGHSGELALTFALAPLRLQFGASELDAQWQGELSLRRDDGIALAVQAAGELHGGRGEGLGVGAEALALQLADAQGMLGQLSGSASMGAGSALDAVRVACLGTLDGAPLSADAEWHAGTAVPWQLRARVEALELDRYARLAPGGAAPPGAPMDLPLVVDVAVGQLSRGALRLKDVHLRHRPPGRQRRAE